MGGDQPGDGQAVAEGLGHAHDVRPHPGVLDAEEATGATEAALHLVADQQDAVLVADLAQARQERGRRHHEAPLTLQRLDHDGRHRVAGHHGLEEVLDLVAARDRAHLVGAVVAVAETVRVADVVHAGKERAHPVAVLRLARGERERAVGAPVEPAGEGDDLGAARWRGAPA